MEKKKNSKSAIMIILVIATIAFIAYLSLGGNGIDKISLPKLNPNIEYGQPYQNDGCCQQSDPGAGVDGVIGSP